MIVATRHQQPLKANFDPSGAHHQHRSPRITLLSIGFVDPFFCRLIWSGNPIKIID